MEKISLILLSLAAEKSEVYPAKNYGMIAVIFTLSVS